MQRCLVTGASGFIGRHLCKHLQQQGLQVRAWLRQASEGSWQESIMGDLQAIGSDQTLNESCAGIDTLFHLGAIAHTRAVSDADYWAMNVGVTEALMQLAIRAGVSRVIYFSSVKAIDPDDAYGRSKQAAAQLVLDLGARYGLHVCVLEPSLVYGIPLKGHLLSLLRAIDQGWFLPIPETHNQRSMISVQDLVVVACLLAQDSRSNGKTYVVSDGVPYSNRQIVDAMRAALSLKPIGAAVPLSLLRAMARVGDCLGHISPFSIPFNTVLLEKLLGSAYYPAYELEKDFDWKPSVHLWQSLPSIVQHYQDTKKKSETL